ncbi:MAG: hypothetical protein ACXWXS_03915, partial [Actinomycetota bacterium]
AATIGLLLGAAWGSVVAAETECIAEFFPPEPNGSCYVLIGRYVSDETYYRVAGAAIGASVGFGFGLLILVIDWAWRRDRAAAERQDSESRAV